MEPTLMDKLVSICHVLEILLRHLFRPDLWVLQFCNFCTLKCADASSERWIYRTHKLYLL